MRRKDMFPLWLLILLFNAEEVHSNELRFVIPSLKSAATLSIETLDQITDVVVAINEEHVQVSNQNDRGFTISLTFDGGTEMIEGINKNMASYLTLNCDRCEPNILTSARLKYEGLSPIAIYPSESLANEYKIVTYCQILGSCFAMIALDSDSYLASVTISLGRGASVLFNNFNCYGEVCEINSLEKRDLVMIKCHRCDLTGTTIRSNAKLAVFVGGNDTVVRTGKTSTSFMSQMTPETKWGREYILISPDINTMGDIIQIIARYNDTIVRMDGYPHARILDNRIMQRVLNYGNITHVSANKPIVVIQLVSDGNGNSAMVIVPPTEQYFEENFNVPCQNASKTVLVTHIKETIASSATPTRIGVSEYQAVSVDDSCNEPTGSAKELIFMVSSKTHIDIVYYASLNLKDVLITKVPVPGDEVDNDNDGLIDEDHCEFGIRWHCSYMNMDEALLDTMEKYNKAKGYLQQSKNLEWTFIRIKDINTISNEWKNSNVDNYRYTVTVISLSSYRWSKYWEIRPFLCGDIEEDGDTCSPGSYQNKDHIGYRFVFPVLPSNNINNIRMETIISTLENDTYFHMDHFIDGQLFKQIMTHWKEKQSTSYPGNYDNRLQTYHISSYMDLTISIILNVDGKKSSMLMYPVDVWGLEYYAASYCSGSCSSFCLITAAYDHTIVTVLFPPFDVPPTVSVRSLEGTETINKSMLKYEIQNNTFIQISSEVDLTGAYIKGNNPISVICGALTDQYLISEQLIPVKFLQAGPYNNVFLSVNTIMEQKIRVMATNTLTKCNLTTTSTSTAESFSSDFMFTMYGEFHEINNNEYYTDTNVHITCDRPVMVWGVHKGFDNDAYMVQYYPGHDGSRTPWQDVNSEFYGTFDEIVFIDNEVCILGEGEDSDCDGHTKEEYCVLDGYNFFPEKHLLEDGKFIPDYDFDGQYDEDCITILPDCGMPNISNGEVSNINEQTETHVMSVLAGFRCRVGYTAIPPITEMTCYANGSWYPTLDCQKDCENPEDVFNNSRSSAVNVLKWSIGQNISMECNEGFSSLGDPLVTCGVNSEWDTQGFRCAPDCVNPTTIFDNTVIINQDTDWSVGQSVTLECSVGFSPLGNLTVTCGDNSIWETQGFRCAPDCMDPTNIFINSVIINEDTDWSVGQSATLNCLAGFSPLGDLTVTCGDNSTWESRGFICAPDCNIGPTNLYDNSEILISTDPWSVGSQLVMRCQGGYTLFGNSSIECQINSTWEAGKFRCLKDCQTPIEDYDNSVIKTNGSWAVNSSVVMGCDTERGYVLQGISVLTCQEGGTWTQDMFFCIEGCEDPTNITNNSLPRYPDRPRALGSRHVMVCGEGYSVKGDAFIQCLNDSIWSPPEFTCVQSCSDPRLASEFSYIPRYVDGTPFLEGTTVNVKCNSSSTLVGNGRMTCLRNRKWSSTYKCIKHCPDPRTVFDFPNAYLKKFNKDSSTAYGTSYQFRCRLFYTLYGNSKITCLESSTWNAVNITCKTCKCLCRKRGTPRYDNITDDVENTIKEELKGELQVEKTKVSAAVAKKVSAKDERKSSQNIGAFGIVLFTLVIGTIIAFDLINVYFFFKGKNNNAVEST